MTRRYFEDITDGERLICQNVIVTREDIITFAKKFDPQPFHTDEDAARESIFGGLIASSLHILSACTRAVVEAQGDVAILSGVGMDEAKMFNPVRPEIPFMLKPGGPISNNHRVNRIMASLRFDARLRIRKETR